MTNKLKCIHVDYGIHLSTDKKFKPCCQSEIFPEITSKEYTIQEAYDSDQFKQLRNNFKNGLKDSICKRCWDNEELGIESLRQSQLKRYNNLYNGHESLKFLELSLSNTCNLKCRTCYPRDSTKWIKEFYDLDIDKNTISYRNYRKIMMNNEDINSLLIDNLLKETLSNLQYITFFGGEPFMERLIWNKILTSAEEKICKNINISFTTNCTFWDDEKEVILSKFKTCELYLSIDGVENKFEYMRHPAKWNTVLNNIEKIIRWQKSRPELIKLNILLTVCIYNIFDFNEVIDFANQRNIEIYLNIVQYPDYLNIQNLPKIIKEHVFKNISLNKYSEDIIKFMTGEENDIILWNKFKEETKKRDNYRNENFLETFTEFQKFSNIC
jgi:sulfatase maturation enzyme AslB (radical SAM superfamily)